MSSRGRGIHSSDFHNQRRRRMMLNASSANVGITVPVVPQDEISSSKIEPVTIKIADIQTPDELVEKIQIQYHQVHKNLQEPKTEILSTDLHHLHEKTNIEKETRNLLLNDLREMIAGEKPVRWFFAGDDVVGGNNRAGEDPGFVDLFSERIRWELRRFPDVIINAGQPDICIHRFGDHFEKNLLDFKPDVLMLMPGRRESLSGRMNLNLFRENLRKLVRMLRKRQVTVVLQTPPPYLEEQFTTQVLDADYNYSLSFFIEAIREIACEHEFPLIDHYEDWEQLSLASQLTYIDQETQKITGAGQRRLCSLIFHELDLFDNKSPICRMCYSAN